MFYQPHRYKKGIRVYNKRSYFPNYQIKNIAENRRRYYISFPLKFTLTVTISSIPYSLKFLRLFFKKKIKLFKVQDKCLNFFYCCLNEG